RRTEARRRNCNEEVRLNRRLATDVYRAVVPLTIRSHKAKREPDAERKRDSAQRQERPKSQIELQLNRPGIVDDWLVCMRRLPADRMLDRAIEKHMWSNEDLAKVGALLARFYSTTEPLTITAEQYM